MCDDGAPRRPADGHAPPARKRKRARKSELPGPRSAAAAGAAGHKRGGDQLGRLSAEEFARRYDEYWRQVGSIITRTSHYESLAMGGAGYNVNDRSARCTACGRARARRTSRRRRRAVARGSGTRRCCRSLTIPSAGRSWLVMASDG